MAVTADQPKAVLLRGGDNVAVAARPIPKGFVLDMGARRVAVREPVSLGHKLAIADVASGEAVRKYGQIIGFASCAIPAGSLVHGRVLFAGQQAAARFEQWPDNSGGDRVGRGDGETSL